MKILRNKLFRYIFFIIFLFCNEYFLFAIEKGSIEATSQIDWITQKFTTNIKMDTVKAEIKMPTGKKTATSQIKLKLPQLTQSPLLSLYADSSKTLADYVVLQDLSLEDVYAFITSGYKTPDVFSSDFKYLNTTNTLNINQIGQLLVKHKYPYTPEEPIDTVPSRKYTGIIIDARGLLEVHGEYIKDSTYPCFFPKIWDENMNTIYERSMVNTEIAKTNGIISYDYTDDPKRYEKRIGADPLYIKAVEVYGRNRTDPIIKRSDALKILTIPENIKLLSEGKVVILLDKQNLAYKIAAPELNPRFYVSQNPPINSIIYPPIPDTEIIPDDPTGIIHFISHLNFYPDSSKLLASEEEKIAQIVARLKELSVNDGYTIVIEGHTADVGKPVGQLNLSRERAKAIYDELIKRGIDKSILTYKGYGGTLPIASNDTEDGRKQNRRVELHASPRTTYVQKDN